PAGNLSQASFDWTFPGTTTPNVQGQTPGVPAGATSFTLTITFPGGYVATASGNINQVSLVAALSLVPNPVLINTSITLTNQMQNAPTTTLTSVDPLIATGACGAPPAIPANPLAASFLTSGGTATVPAGGTVGNFCLYLKYNYTPSGGQPASQTVSNAFATT